MNCKIIKLVIWDLDDTFWKGTLSEGPIEPILENIELVKNLTDRGIVNTICSKNDFEPTVAKLQELGVADFFVFKSIDWTPKGQRISQLIKDMGLRPANCLFIDDNVVNLNEAQFYSKELMIANPSEIRKLIDHCGTTAASDTKHKRLSQYRVLEEKQKAKEEVGDNMKFLYASNTKVELHNDCKPMADRIFELINRTNQLNYTKYRCSREELDALLDDKDVNCGYVTVIDNFGDYGIVGFYAIKDNKCIHFLFSCRTIGQGVEQWVYSTLRFPELTVIGSVINNVERTDPPAWINQTKENSSDLQNKTKTKIVFKGACDLQIMASYLISDNIVEEFTYVGAKRKNSIEHHNHSVNILRYPFMSKEEQYDELQMYPFCDEEMFKTALFDSDIQLVFLSTQIEPNLGLYRNKTTGNIFAFGEYTYPLTDSNNWGGYISGTIFTSHNKFDRGWLKNFSLSHDFLGQLTPPQIIENYKKLLSKLNPNAKLCLILGSELPFEKNTQKSYENRHLFYKQLNGLLRDYAKTESRLYLLDLNEFIHDQEDFTDNINHYKRAIYYKAAQAANKIIAKSTNINVKNKNKLYLYQWLIVRKLKDIIKQMLNINKM